MESVNELSLVKVMGEKITPSVPKGFRDFSSEVLLKRKFISDIISSAYQLFGFDPIETPTLEKLAVLTGKYGDEGDQLLFKVLNNGDFLAKTTEDELTSRDAPKILSKIAQKGLRYDLTVPFARYVSQHRNDITFPFKRYQIQPVWRADRPQKGRYREFVQCDADVIGSNSLLAEFEFIQIYDRVFKKLGLRNYKLRLNNRKILQGLAESIGVVEKFTSLTIAIDKLDKVGIDGVKKELTNNNFTDEQVKAIAAILELTGSNSDKLRAIKETLSGSEIGLKGIEEMQQLLTLTDTASLSQSAIHVDLTLARGLTYYTGTIFEVIISDSGIGSVSGGGRYDDLTDIFGLPNMSGVGISFGLDRIYDVMDALSKWPETLKKRSNTVVLVTYTDKDMLTPALDFVEKLRFNGIKSEIYLDQAKIKKQFKYANDKGIPLVVTIGEREMETGKFQLKDMTTGAQQALEPAYIINALKNSKSRG